jgi:hypothetical protein
MLHEEVDWVSEEEVWRAGADGDRGQESDAQKKATGT